MAKELNSLCVFNNEELIKMAFPNQDPTPCGGVVKARLIQEATEGGKTTPDNLVHICKNHLSWLWPRSYQDV